MSCDVPCYVLVCAAFLGDNLDPVLAVRVARYRKQFTILCHTLVFLDDVFGYFQQADIAFRSRFLAVGFNPQMTVKGDLQVLFRQVRHIRPAQARKRAENEQITDQLVALLLECTVD